MDKVLGPSSKLLSSGYFGPTGIKVDTKEIINSNLRVSWAVQYDKSSTKQYVFYFFYSLRLYVSMYVCPLDR